MAGPNSFQQSPFQSLIDKQPAPLPGAQQVTEVDTPDMGQDAPAAAPVAPVAPAPTPPAAPRAAAPVASLLPPPEMRPLFEATAAHFNVPVNVLMAIAHQESGYNSDATNKDTGAAGMAQYVDATAKSLGINPRDPNEAIPAAAQQIRERLDKGYSMQDAVAEHFAGPDRKKWGEKTAAYSAEVLGKAGQIGQALYGDSTDATPAQPDTPAAPVAGPEQNQFSPDRMARADYEKDFRALNPRANDAAVANAMAQYDQKAAAKTQAAGNRVQDKFKTMQSPEATFDARLNAKLQGQPNGVVPQLPDRQQPASFPETGTPATAPSTFDTVAGNVTGGALGTIVGAIAAGAHYLGADDVAKEYGEGLDQIRARQHELGGDTFAGKVSNLVGGILPAMTAAPESKVLEFVKNAGLFGVPAYKETYEQKLAEGQSPKLAMVHAFESFGMNTLAPLVMQHGAGAILGKIGAEGAAGVKGAALGVGQAAGEGAAFSAANTVMDKGTDVLAGQQNDRPWIDPQDMAVQMAGFGGIRAAHTVGHAAAGVVPETVDPSTHAADAARADALSRWQNDGLSPSRAAVAPDGRVEPTMGDAPAQADVDAAVARADEAARAGKSVNDQLIAIRGPIEPVGPLSGAVEHAAAAPTSADAGPMSEAIAQAADLHAVDPAPAPDMPPAPPDYTAMSQDELKARVKEIATQGAQATDPNRRVALRTERETIEREIAARGKQAKADSKPAVEPLSAGPFDDMKAANRMMERYAEETGQPHEVVGSEGKFRVQAIGGGNGIDTAGSGTGTDGRGRSGGSADEVGSDLGAGRAGAGTGVIEGERDGSGLPAEKRGADAGDYRTGADGTADAQPALTQPENANVPERPQVPEEAPVASGAKGSPKAEASSAPAVVDRHSQLLKDLEQVGSTRAQVLEFQRDRARENLANLEAHPHLNKRDQAEEVGKLKQQISDLDAVEQRARDMDAKDARDDTSRAMLKSAKQELDASVLSGDMSEHDASTAIERARNTGNAAAATESIYSDVDKAAAPTKPEGKLAARRALNDRQDAIVKAATEKLAARKAEKDAAAQPAEEAPTPDANPVRAEPPLSFMKKVKVDHDVYISDERRWETAKVPAHVALKSVREDIDNLESLLNCMKG